MRRQTFRAGKYSSLIIEIRLSSYQSHRHQSLARKGLFAVFQFWTADAA
ncbi:hypothetical protein B14911_20408 [Bacillus sp. NRRL B-14911]|nr:hypothetical protein B14911_20408 [Bacillus sp. NRRL B-14911]